MPHLHLPYPLLTCQKNRFLCIGNSHLLLGSGAPLGSLGRKLSFFRSHDPAQRPNVRQSTPSPARLPPELIDRFLEKRPALEWIIKFLVHPIIAGLLFTVVFSFWHIGAFYEAALRDKVIHMAEHLSMFFVSFLMWVPICSESKRIPQMRFGPQMLYVLGLMLGQTPIFAFLTFSEEVLYDTYFYAERIMNLSPLEDQRAGGVLMKLANMAVSLAFCHPFFTDGPSNNQPKPEWA